MNVLPGAEHRGEQNVRLPLFAPETFIDAGGDVTGGRAEANEQHHRAGHEGAAIRRREETQAGES